MQKAQCIQSSRVTRFSYWSGLAFRAHATNARLGEIKRIFWFIQYETNPDSIGNSAYNIRIYCNQLQAQQAHGSKTVLDSNFKWYTATHSSDCFGVFSVRNKCRVVSAFQHSIYFSFMFVSLLTRSQLFPVGMFLLQLISKCNVGCRIWPQAKSHQATVSRQTWHEI